MPTNSIYNTLAFFDAQDLPLTPLEIRNYLGETSPLKVRGDKGELLFEIEKTIHSELSGKVEHRDGLYFLPGRQDLVSTRLDRYKISLLRFRKCRKFLSPLRFFPYLRVISISGSLALLNSTADSDIDLFIITKKNRIWLSRALVSLYFQILGQRRYKNHVKNRFCLNHYVCEGQVITEDRNLYTAVEYSSLLPVLGTGELENFWKANSWIKEYVSAPAFEKNSYFFGFEFSAWQKILEGLLDFTLAPVLNYVLGLYQKHRIRKEDYILVSDQELSFHPGSRGQNILAEFQKRI